MVQRRTNGEIRGEERESEAGESQTLCAGRHERPQTTDTTDHTPHAQPSQRLQWVQGCAQQAHRALSSAQAKDRLSARPPYERVLVVICDFSKCLPSLRA